MTRRPAVTRLATSAILAVFVGVPLPATTLARLDLNQLAHAADVVARVRCADTGSYVQEGTVWTRTEFVVVETLKGSPSARIAVRLPGGHMGRISVYVDAVPRFQRGEEGVLFLEKLPAGEYSVTGWALGSFRIHRNDHTTEETVTQDSSATAVFDAASRRFVNEGIREMPLSEFRRKLNMSLRAPMHNAARP